MLRFYPQATNAETSCDVGGAQNSDLGITQPAGASITNSTTSDTYVPVIVSDLDVSAWSLHSANWTYQLNFPMVQIATGLFRVRVEAIDGSCSVVAASSYVAITGAGTMTGTFSALSWPAGAVRLRLAVEALSLDGIASATIRIGVATSWIEAAIVWKPRLALIAEAIDARLALIAGGATVYNFTIGAHGITRRRPEEVSDLPACYIAQMRLLDRSNKVLGNASGKMREAVGEYSLLLHVSAEAGDSALRLFARDVTRAIEGNPHLLNLAAYVLDVIVQSFEPFSEDAETDKTLRSGLMIVSVPYRMGRGEL